MILSPTLIVSSKTDDPKKAESWWSMGQTRRSLGRSRRSLGQSRRSLTKTEIRIESERSFQTQSIKWKFSWVKIFDRQIGFYHHGSKNEKFRFKWKSYFGFLEFQVIFKRFFRCKTSVYFLLASDPSAKIY